MSKAIRLLNRIKDRRVHIPAVIVLLIATLASASILVVGRLKSGNDSRDVNYESPRVAPSQRRVQVVYFTLYDAGIYPAETRADPGRVTVSVEDLTGSGSGVLVERIEENARVPAGAVNKAANRSRSRSELELPPGRYEVVDATRPANRALLIVEADR